MSEPFLCNVCGKKVGASKHKRLFRTTNIETGEYEAGYDHLWCALGLPNELEAYDAGLIPNRSALSSDARAQHRKSVNVSRARGLVL